jgi:transcriptional regulator with XRE-family HTH domain
METLSLTEQVRARMRAFRITAGYSQSQMAGMLAMDERNYKRIENGEKKLMDTDLLERYCTALQLPVDSLLLGCELLERVNEMMARQWAALRQLVESMHELEQVLHAPAANPTPLTRGRKNVKRQT